MLENVVTAGLDTQKRERFDRVCRVAFPAGYGATLAIILLPAVL